MGLFLKKRVEMPDKMILGNMEFVFDRKLGFHVGEWTVWDRKTKAPPHNSRLGAQAACRAKIFRDIFQKCSPIRQGLPALFGSSHKKFFGTLHHLGLCGVALKFSLSFRAQREI